MYLIKWINKLIKMNKSSLKDAPVWVVEITRKRGEWNEDKRAETYLRTKVDRIRRKDEGSKILTITIVYLF